MMTSDSEENELICAAGCMEVISFDDPATVCLNPCDHRFHLNCVVKWFKISKSNKCPLCRILTKEFVKTSGECIAVRQRPQSGESRGALGDESDEYPQDEYHNDGDDTDDNDAEYIQCIVCQSEISNEDDVRMCADCDGFVHNSCILIPLSARAQWRCRYCLHIDTLRDNESDSDDEVDSVSNTSLTVNQRQHTESRDRGTRSNAHSRPSSSSSGNDTDRTYCRDTIRERILQARASAATFSSASNREATTPLDTVNTATRDMILARNRMKMFESDNRQGGYIHLHPDIETDAKKSIKASRKRKAGSFIDEMDDLLGSSESYGLRTTQKNTSKIKSKTNSSNSKNSSYQQTMPRGRFSVTGIEQRDHVNHNDLEVVAVSDVSLANPLRERSKVIMKARHRNSRIMEKYLTYYETLKSITTEDVSMQRMEDFSQSISDIALCLDQHIIRHLLDLNILNLFGEFLQPRPISASQDSQVYLSAKTREIVLRTIDCFNVSKRHLESPQSSRDSRKSIVDVIKFCASLRSTDTINHGNVHLLANKILKKWKNVLEKNN